MCETDIDECLIDSDGCDQICNNVDGSYECLCEDGYVLNGDMHSCDDFCSSDQATCAECPWSSITCDWKKCVESQCPSEFDENRVCQCTDSCVGDICCEDVGFCHEVQWKATDTKGRCRGGPSGNAYSPNHSGNGFTKESCKTECETMNGRCFAMSITKGGRCALYLDTLETEIPTREGFTPYPKSGGWIIGEHCIDEQMEANMLSVNISWIVLVSVRQHGEQLVMVYVVQEIQIMYL
eukprot:UN06919